jgi:hypothetical protein
MSEDNIHLRHWIKLASNYFESYEKAATSHVQLELSIPSDRPMVGRAILTLPTLIAYGQIWQKFKVAYIQCRSNCKCEDACDLSPESPKCHRNFMIINFNGRRHRTWDIRAGRNHARNSGGLEIAFKIFDLKVRGGR